MALVKLLEATDVGRLAIIKSLLDANGISYVVRNEHFGSLYPGVTFPTNNGMIVMVNAEDYDRADMLLKDFKRGTV